VKEWVGSFYRLLFNVFAIVSLVLVLILIPHTNDATIVEWRGPLVAIQAIVWSVALLIWCVSIRSLSTKSFWGLDAFGRKHADHARGQLVTWSIYSVIRHPGYLAGLMLLWTRDLTGTDLVTNAVLSLYLIVGAKIEERRLLNKYGNQYRQYMARVPGFIPADLSALKAAIGSK
jgi:protein-S-isoprenylcysteine O-methyltransferase Ste14